MVSFAISNLLDIIKEQQYQQQDTGLHSSDSDPSLKVKKVDKRLTEPTPVKKAQNSLPQKKRIAWQVYISFLLF